MGMSCRLMDAMLSAKSAPYLDSDGPKADHSLAVFRLLRFGADRSVPNCREDTLNWI